MTKPVLSIGDAAPNFTMPTDGGGYVTLSDLRGKTVVLYFYPRDNTPACTTEASDFRDLHPNFNALDAVIIGVSMDSPKKHDRFKAKYNLPFMLATDDENATVCQQYGVWRPKKFMGREFLGLNRMTFVIDGNGIVTHIWDKVRVKNHAQSVLDALQG